MVIHSLLLHSVSYSGSWGQHFLPLEEFVERAARLGFHGVMIMAKRPHLSVLDWDAGRCERLAAHMRKSDLGEVVIAGYTNFTADPEHPEIPHRELQIRHVVDLAERAQALGGKLIRIFTGYETAGVPPEAARKTVVDALRECAQRAAEFGVTVGVQNHHDIACDYRSLHDLILEVDEPNCRAMFDAWAPALQGTDLGSAAKFIGSLTVHTTFANYQLRPRFRYRPELVNYEALTPMVQAVPMDEGFIDYATFLSALQSVGFRGSVAYEMCSPLAGGGRLENLDGYASAFLHYMQRLTPTAVGIAETEMARP
jgi:sugar phosphate isomerase/epimerase